MRVKDNEQLAKHLLEKDPVSYLPLGCCAKWIEQHLGTPFLLQVYTASKDRVKWLLEQKEGYYTVQVIGKDRNGEDLEHVSSIDCKRGFLFEPAEE